MGPMLDIQHLTKRFGTFAAVDDVTFAADRGEVLGFLGPNGAGKTTTMRMIVGFLAPTGGRAIVCGHDVAEDPSAVKRMIGYLPEGAPLYEDMTPLGLLRFVADVRRLSGRTRRDAIARAVDQLQLDEVLAQPIGTLSKGFKRRVGFAQAILHDPDVLILDEPTDGLDPNQKHEVRALINRMAAGKAIVISTHLLEEVEAVCSRAVIIARGRLVFDGTPEMLQAKSALHNAVRIQVAPPAAESCRVNLAGLEGVARVDVVNGTDGIARLVAVPAEGRSIVEAVSARLQAKGIAVEELTVERGRLDEVFRRITTEA